MKNIRYLIPFLFIFCTFSLPLSSFSQVSSKGYEISFKPQGVNDKYLYLVGIYGNKTWVVDSAKY